VHRLAIIVVLTVLELGIHSSRRISPVGFHFSVSGENFFTKLNEVIEHQDNADSKVGDTPVHIVSVNA
jgi:hypothetical protein